MLETQQTICDWATKTFGNSYSPEIHIRRMLEECKELEEKSEMGIFSHEELADEIADIFICGYRAMDALGFDTHSCIDHKMAINRHRKWKLNGDGTGQHVKE